MEGCFMFQWGGFIFKWAGGGTPMGGIGFGGRNFKKKSSYGGAPLLRPPTMGSPDPHINICVRSPNTCVALKQFNLLPPSTLFRSNFIYYPLTHHFEAG